MLPQITADTNINPSILEIPSKTYKLNIDSEANAPYELDSKNKVYLKIKKDNGYITSNTCAGTILFNKHIYNDVKIVTEFEVLDTLSNNINLLNFTSNDSSIKISISKHFWQLQYNIPSDDYIISDPIYEVYEYDTQYNYKYHVVCESKTTSTTNNIRVWVNNELFFSISIPCDVFIADNYSFRVNYKFKKLYKYDIIHYESEQEIYSVKAKPFYYNNIYGLLDTLDNNISSAFKYLSTSAYGDTTGIVEGHLFAYPQSEEGEVSFSIVNGNLIAESDNLDELNKYYRLNHNIWFRTIAYSERIMGNIDGLNAIKQAVYKILMTERYSYLIYSNDYGVELEQYIGKDFNYLEATIGYTLKDALTYDLRIKDVEVNDISKKDDKALVKFTVYSIYGDLQMEVVISV